MADQFRVVENVDPRIWDDFVCSHDGHLLQSCAWGELKARFGWAASRVAVERAGSMVAAAQILFRHFPLGLRLAYVPRGPVVDSADGTALVALLEALAATARAHRAFALELEPNWPETLFATGIPAPLRGWRIGASHQPRTTIHLDLTRDLDAIIAQMRPKWRYNIRLASRKGVTVREGTDTDLPRFYDLLQVTSARDRFAVHSIAYYRAAFELMGDHARLFIAELEREPLAAIFVTAFGKEAIYLYGASSNEHRECMPNHALHWAAIQWARTQGCTRYDLWGIAESKPLTKDEGRTTEASVHSSFVFRPSSVSRPSSLPVGLYQFKQGFGGNVVRYVGAFDQVFSPAQFTLYQRALRLRRSGLT